MPHRSFSAARTDEQLDPITFDFGALGEEAFTVRRAPSLGDVLDLYDAPEPAPENELQSVRVLVNFLRRMLEPEDVDRFNAALRRMPADSALPVVLEAASWVAEQVSGFPSPPAVNSSGGRRESGKPSRPRPGSAYRSRR